MAGMTPGGAMAQSNPGNPASLPTKVVVNILAPILISEDFNLSFGKLIPPTTGVQSFTVGTDGTMTVGTGDGQAISGHRAGQYDITGTAGEQYLLTVAFNGCSDANLNMSGATNNAPVPTILNQLDVNVGGTLAVAAGVPLGSHTCSYSITAQYP